MNQTKQTDKTIKICFVVLTAYPILSGKNLGHVIGPDTHNVLLAQELMKHDFKVAFVTYDEGGPPIEYIDGLEIIKTYQLRDIRHLNPALKAFRIWKAMRKAKADIYFYHGGAPGVVSLFSRLLRKKSVWFVTKMPYVYGEFKGLTLTERLLHWLDIHLFDVFLVPNVDEKQALKSNFGRESIFINHHIMIPEQGMPEKAKPPIIIWVGSMSTGKQPELLLELAKEIPEASFQMIGGVGGGDEKRYNKIKEAAEKIQNVEFLGSIFPYHAIDKYYAQASILVNTAKYESYPPAAVLQAWANYAPIVTLNSNEYADEIMYRYKLGFHSRTLQQLKQDVKMLLEDEQLLRQMGENARRYVEENHDISKIVKQHIEVLNQLVKSK